EAGIEPDMVVGHSLGEYAALVAAGVLDLDAALEIVAARGREMTAVSLDDPGRMVAAMADAETVERVIEKVDGYLVPANKNSSTQTVVAGESEAIEKLIKAFEAEGIRAVPLRVSHAFHSRIVAPASEPLSRVLERHEWHPNKTRVFTNVTGEAYPDKAGKDVYVDVLARQIASPVEFVGCVENMYAMGARFFVEVGPRRVLASFADDILSGSDEPVKVTSSNHHRQKDLDALAAMYAAAASAGAMGGTASGASPAVDDGGAGGGEEASSRSTGAATAAPAGGPSIVVSGTALGLPGRDRMLFNDQNVDDLLLGKSFLEAIPEEIKEIFPTLNMTKIDKGIGEEITEQTVRSSDDAIKLAGMIGKFDLAGDYGIDRSFVETMDTTARMAVGAGLEALRDAGIPLVLETRTTRQGVVLPVGWVLPEALRHETGVIFGSCFPGFDSFARHLEAYHEHRLAGKPFTFDRKVLFGILAMGHTQFAQAIKATGPNLQINAACASGALAIATAGDWMKAGRCKRVIVLTADEASSPHMLPWVGGGFLSNGAAATDARVEDAALPFDERRHGLLVGAGAAALVLEVEDEVRARGAAPLARIVHTQISNSAYHGTRLHSEHITGEMVRFLSSVEAITGLSPDDLADRLIFLSHETYTPARGGSADTEVDALRAGFGIRGIRKVLVTNTKGFTGHPMGTGFEDAIAPWILHTGRVPPIANLSRTDRRFVDLNLSRGDRHDARWVLRFSAGFGSQVAMVLFEKASSDEVRIVDRALNAAWMDSLLGGKPAALEVKGRVLHLVEAAQANASAAAREKTMHDEPAARTAEASPNGLRSEIMTLIAEKTGYPEDMLDPDMDMEADLGIDTVKQAEVFASVRRTYDIPRQDNLKLSDYPTINHVVEFVRSFAKDEAPAEAPAAAPAAAPAPASAPAPAKTAQAEPAVEAQAPAAASGGDLLAEIMKVVAEKTGYPEDMLDPDMDMEADLGIDTVKQAELFATVRRTYDIPRQDNLKLSDYPTINHVVEFVRSFAKDVAPADAVAPASAPEPASPAQAEPAVEAQAPAAASGRDLLAEVMKVVAEKTGYPEDMLDPDMDMEADLGIDTVKQAELFAEVRRTYDIPRQDNLKLSDYPTINHVVEFVRSFAKDEAPASAPEAVPVSARSPAPDVPVEGFDARMLVPAPRWMPPASAFGETGQSLDGGGEPVVVAGSGRVHDALKALLAERGVPVEDASGSGEGSVRGVILVDDPDGGSLDPAGIGEYCAGVVDTAVERFNLVKELITQKRLEPGRCFVIGVTSMGGTFGYGSDAPDAPSGGALAGFVKALAFELPGSLVKVVDLDPADDPGDGAGRVVHEIEGDPLTTEVGYSTGQRWGVTMNEEPPPAGEGSMLPERPVILMTGGAGGIMVEIAERLASRYAARLVLTDILDPEKDADGRIIDAIERVERAGGTALYVTADVTDASSVDSAVAAAVSRFGRIDAVLHGAGVEESRGIARKTEESFRLIVGIKAAGAGNLVASVMKRTRPSSFLFFSSVAGRFGNAGQVDYSAGNDFITKLASSLTSRHPGTRFMAVDWTAWDGPGMAGNTSIRALLDDAGIEVLDRSEGTELACRFVGSPACLPPEAVVARALGVLEERLARADAREVAVRVADEVKCPGRASWSAGSVSWTLTIDPAQAKWLWDHAVDGTPVFPAVMGLDAFVQMASTILGDSLVLSEIEQVHLHRAVKFFDGKPRELRVAMEPVSIVGGKVRARCWLDTENRNKVEGGRVVHFDAFVAFGPSVDGRDGTVVLTRGDGIDMLGQSWESHDSAEAVYEHLFHGPEFQVLGEFQHGGARPDAALGTLCTTSRIAPKGLYRLTELGMQTAGMWLLRSSGLAALPASMDSVHVLGKLEDGGSHRAISVYRGQEDHGVEGIHHRFDVSIRSEASGAVVWIEGLRLVETGPRPEARQPAAGEGKSVRKRAPAV
ncbi:MAG: SDR family NAD(P)-dependent oxidoreductase, partial [Deltaproteobacteria bacterium]|nr:SDR family NAD(P)-dependent oxidoreductase [Deltaproteobacteria bacterium]